jgi:hypothetical protein
LVISKTCSNNIESIQEYLKMRFVFAASLLTGDWIICPVGNEELVDESTTNGE